MGLLDTVRGGLTSLARSRASSAIGAANEVARSFGNVTSRSYAESGSSRVGSVDPLSAAMGRPDPLMTYDWFCTLPLLNRVPAPTSLSWDRVEEATLPQVEFEPVSNYKAGKMYHFANHHALGTLTCKLYEDAGGTSMAFIRNWQSLIMDRETGLYNPPSLYKLPITFTLFDSEKQDVVYLTYLGCWPQTHDAIQLESGQSNRVTVNVTFSVDDLTMAFAQYSSKDLASSGYTGEDSPAAPSTDSSVFVSTGTDATNR